MKDTFKGFDSSSHSYLPDEDIINLYWARDEKAIEETDVKYGKYLCTIVYNILHDHLDCEECCNDTYLKVWNNIPPTHPNIFQSYLSKITRRIAINRYKQLSRKKRVPSELTVSLDEISDTLADVEASDKEYNAESLGNLINSFLSELGEKRQFIFIYRYYYADTVAMISEMVGLSERMVYMELSSIRRELRQYLEEEGYFI